MWRELIETAGRDRTDKAMLHPGCSPQEIDRVQRVLGVTFPEALKQLLLETNGVSTEYGSFVWPVEQVEKTNLEFRDDTKWGDLYMPFDCLLFFGNNGNGDQHAFRILRGVADGGSIYVWDHESDSRTMVAGHLKSFVDRWLRQEIDN